MALFCATTNDDLQPHANTLTAHTLHSAPIGTAERSFCQLWLADACQITRSTILALPAPVLMKSLDTTMQVLTIFEAGALTSIFIFLLWLGLKLREQGLPSMHQATLLVVQQAYHMTLVSLGVL